MRKITFAGLLAAMATAGCVTPAPTTPDPEARQLDVSEAVLRHMFRTLQGRDRTPIATYCLGVRKRFPGPVADAPPALLDRMTDLRPAVKPYSGCVSKVQVLDGVSGRPAVIFHVGPIACGAPNRCTATGAYMEASLSGAATEYELERRGNNWVVVSQELRAVS